MPKPNPEGPFLAQLLNEVPPNPIQYAYGEPNSTTAMVLRMDLLGNVDHERAQICAIPGGPDSYVESALALP